MFLVTILDKDYNKEVAPFLKNGVIIDTSVIIDLIKGLIETRIKQKPISQLPDYDNLIKFLDFIKAKSSWNRFLITPHILTEVCRRVRDDYSSQHNYKNIVREIMIPLLEPMNELMAKKKDFISKIELGNPRLDAGDISLYVVTDDFILKKDKIAILSCDTEMNSRYEYDQNVMIMDYKMIMLNSL